MTFKPYQRVIVKSLLITCAIAFIASIVFSRVYWGYFFFRPSLPSQIDTLDQITSVVPFHTRDDAPTSRVFVAYPEMTIGHLLDSCKKHPYDCDYGRILLRLQEKMILPKEFSYNLRPFPSVPTLLEASRLLVPSDEGYDSLKYMNGILARGVTRDGTELLVLGAYGGEVSNDHHPYYEAIFSLDRESHLKYLAGTLYFADVAGVEGFEWYYVWLLTSVIGSLVVVPVSLLAWVIIMKIRGRPNQAL
jgi:hypothetical protein